MQTDLRIDAYIERAAPFAQPILAHLRALLAAACPDGEETLKWNMPNIVYRGKILCNMAAFKAHASFGFWQNSRVTGEDASSDAMGQFGKLTSVADLPDDATLTGMIRKAMELIDSGTRTARPVKHAKPPLEMPEDLATALAGSPAAKTAFDGFPPSAQREYLEWIVGAKRPETRKKRLDTTLAQLADGKRLNWKYQDC